MIIMSLSGSADGRALPKADHKTADDLPITNWVEEWRVITQVPLRRVEKVHEEDFEVMPHSVT